MSKRGICPFCDQEQNYRRVVVNKYLQVMYPKNPASAYHLLLIPIRHVEHIDQMTTSEWGAFGTMTKKIVDTAQIKIPQFMGYNLLSNNGDERVRQRVKHAHIHLFLRTESETEDPVRASHTGTPQELNQEELNNLKFLKDIFKSIS